MEATTVGNWSQIGYNAPGTQGANGSTSNTNNFGYGDALADNKATWTATALHTLNDCTAGGKWVLEASAEHTSSTGTTYVKIDKGSASTDKCVGLTPSFTNLIRTTAL